MKAIFLTKYGTPQEAFELREIEKPTLENDELLIECEGFGLNYADVMARQGLYKGAPPTPCVLGYDVVGKVVEVKDESYSHLLGKRVVGLTKFGGYAEFAKTKLTAVTEIPSSLSIAEGTAIATQYCTAYYASSFITNLHQGDRVLIHAAAGGVGTALTQIAKAKGCEVYGLTSSTKKFDYLKNNGVDFPINLSESAYQEQFIQLSKGIKADVIFNSMGGKSIQEDMRILSVGGRLVNYGAASISGKKPNLFTLLGLLRKTGKVKPLKLLGKSSAVMGVNMLTVADRKPEIIADCLKHVVELMESNPAIKPISGGEFHYSEIDKAHELLSSRKSTGKIAVKWGLNFNEKINIITYDDDNIDSKGDSHISYKGNDFTGLLRELREDDSVLWETQYKDGFQHGYEKEFFPDGSLKTENVEYDRRESYSKEWDASGNLISETVFDWGGDKAYSYIEKEWNSSGVLLYHNETIFEDLINFSTNLILDNR